MSRSPATMRLLMSRLEENHEAFAEDYMDVATEGERMRIFLARNGNLSEYFNWRDDGMDQTVDSAKAAAGAPAPWTEKP